MKDQKPLWTKVLKQKYNITRLWRSKSKASPIWRGILSNKDLVTKNVRWTVGNGKDISFWKDWWVGSSPLVNTHNHLNSAFPEIKVSDVIKRNDNWKMDLINSMVSRDTAHNIMNTQYRGQDLLGW